MLQTPEGHIIVGPLSTFGPGIGFKFFFYVVKFLHLAKKRKGGAGEAVAATFMKDFFEIKWPKVAMFQGDKKRKLNLPCLDHRFLRVACTYGV